MKRIDVKNKNISYPVFIGTGNFSLLPGLFDKLKLNRNVFVIIDENVYELYKSKINKVISIYAKRFSIFILRATEQSKSLTIANKIYNQLAQQDFARDTLLISLGGGITGDAAGYCASTYMRGIQLVHIPTTLLAMVDSSIGGKTGVNFFKSKNLIGSFYQPQMVLIDTDFLKTLPKREIKSGIGEIIKYVFLSCKPFFNYVHKNFDELVSLNEVVLNRIILESVLIKASVVSQDEKEEGLRKILNFGHTFAHAFESRSSYKIKHGEAVAAGIIASLFLSHKLHLISDGNLKKYLEIFSKYRLPSSIKKFNNSEVLKHMKLDKKNKGDKIKFVILKDIGKIVIDAEVEKKSIFYAIDRLKKFF